jgi:hypothetical protein
MVSATAEAVDAEGRKVFKGEVSVAVIDRHRLGQSALVAA